MSDYMKMLEKHISAVKKAYTAKGKKRRGTKKSDTKKEGESVK